MSDDLSIDQRACSRCGAQWPKWMVSEDRTATGFAKLVWCRRCGHACKNWASETLLTWFKPLDEWLPPSLFKTLPDGKQVLDWARLGVEVMETCDGE